MNDQLCRICGKTFDEDGWFYRHTDPIDPDEDVHDECCDMHECHGTIWTCPCDDCVDLRRDAEVDQ